MLIEIDLSEVHGYIEDTVEETIKESLKEEIDKYTKPIIRKALKAKKEAIENQVYANYEKFINA